MVVRTIKPTGIHARRLGEKTKKSQIYERGIEIKKVMPENKLKDLKKEIYRAKIAFTDRIGDDRIAERKINSAQQEYYKEKLRIQGKLLEAFDKYYGFDGKLNEINRESALTYGKSLFERDQMNTYILNELNRIKSKKDAPLILRIIKKEMLIRFKMQF